jgi:hypothetical protein
MPMRVVLSFRQRRRAKLDKGLVYYCIGSAYRACPAFMIYHFLKGDSECNLSSRAAVFRLGNERKA